MTFYYWTYRSHPHSNEEFLFDGILNVPNEHIAHRESKRMIGDIADDHNSVKHDLGVHIVTPIDDIVQDRHGIEDTSKLNPEDYDNQKLVLLARERITEQDVIEVGERQENFDRHEMGEDVDGVVEFERG